MTFKRCHLHCYSPWHPYLVSDLLLPALPRPSLPPCRTLGALAEKCHAYAKALHYKELEFQSSPHTAVEALISINNQLRQPDAAVGVLNVAQKDLHMDLKESW
jgi:phosphatidylinositol kinase/protein kinase (PI-3  family)